MIEVSGTWEVESGETIGTWEVKSRETRTHNGRTREVVVWVNPATRETRREYGPYDERYRAEVVEAERRVYSAALEAERTERSRRAAAEVERALTGDEAERFGGWTIATTSGAISHRFLSRAPGCPEGRHPTRWCGCRVWRTRAEAVAHIERQVALDTESDGGAGRV